MGNSSQHIRVADQISHLRGRDAGDAINGRAYLRPGQVEFGVLLLRQRGVQRRLIRLQGLNLVIQLRLGDGLLFRERRVARHIELRVAQIRHRARDRCFGLIEGCAQRALIDLEQDLPLSDKIALLIISTDDVTRYLGRYLRIH